MIPVVEACGTVLLFGGCYSNVQATSALLEEARRLGIPPERTICTGDVVAYGADPATTVDVVRDAGVHVVMGNCEESLGERAQDCGCGFTAGSACNRLSAAWYSHADAMLDEEARRWMRSLPRRIDLRMGGRRLAVVHGSPERINEFVFGSSPDDDLRQLVRAAARTVRHGGPPYAIDPATDGGFWLFGGRAPVPAAVWRSVAYSRADTGARLAKALRRFGPIGSIPALADTDEASDLPELASALGYLRDPLPEQASLRDWLHNLRQTPSLPELAPEMS